MNKETMKKTIMSHMTIRQIKALKSECVDLYTWLDAFAALAVAMEGKENG